MQELRLVERRDNMLIFESNEGEQFSLGVTEEIIGAVQSIQRSLEQEANAEAPPVRPREIQALLREGHTAAQVAETLHIDEADVARYAGPIEAEFQFILEQAKAVPVRADITPESPPEQFGEVIEQRLEKLQADTFTWSSWRDPQDGWMVLLSFISRDTLHEAKWMYDHKKRLLDPVTPDAVNLSKQGDVGDKLIPTLRAVDNPGETGFTGSAFHDETSPEAESAEPSEAANDSAAPTQTPAPPEPLSEADEYQRRRGIEERAIASDPEQRDLGETSDLLDALRKRRQDRDGNSDTRSVEDTDTAEVEQTTPKAGPASGEAKPRVNIWQAPAPPEPSTPATTSTPKQDPQPEAPKADEEPAKPEDRKTKKGRTSIPSWDEILFGARGDED